MQHHSHCHSLLLPTALHRQLRIAPASVYRSTVNIRSFQPPQNARELKSNQYYSHNPVFIRVVRRTFLHTMNMQTPPSSPQLQQQRTRQILRDINVSQDSSPHRRRLPRVPAYLDENRPPSSRTTSPTPRVRSNARALAQAERRERERRQREEEPPRVRIRKRPPPRPAPEGPPNARQLAQQKRRERERTEQENRMHADLPPRASQASTRRSDQSRVLSVLPNGLLTPPATQPLHGARRAASPRAELQRRGTQIVADAST
ncbi:hypothetical protein B0H17DRAFT_1151303 [Mycena rosella]|uniref:Uncharacterized protein n=1 Tax=Mycena rosella TaxID=1033263 RepID=A0AAD7BLH2_MYCRO|nr:hypothetical protein B0H17DRAFT_1151303 [Mycena rosella]